MRENLQTWRKYKIVKETKAINVAECADKPKYDDKPLEILLASVAVSREKDTKEEEKKNTSYSTSSRKRDCQHMI